MGSNVMECNYGIHKIGHPTAITPGAVGHDAKYEKLPPQPFASANKIFPSDCACYVQRVAGGCLVAVWAWLAVVVHDGTIPSWMQWLTTVVDECHKNQIGNGWCGHGWQQWLRLVYCFCLNATRTILGINTLD
ncbi:DUF2163 domain-containing protein [Sesbania bispinosa]|nr:DUF2163 domain-containing protein [Sesbania bispinosa]